MSVAMRDTEIVAALFSGPSRTTGVIQVLAFQEGERSTTHVNIGEEQDKIDFSEEECSTAVTNLDRKDPEPEETLIAVSKGKSHWRLIKEKKSIDISVDFM
jgi:hypothetical protein